MLYFRKIDITYIFYLSIEIVCTRWQFMTSEVKQFLQFNQNHSKLDIFLIILRMGNIERHFVQEKYFCPLLVLDSYTSDVTILFVLACA